MENYSLIEESYQKFVKNIDEWIPEGIYQVNLSLLHHFDLLQFHPKGEHGEDPLFHRYFRMSESSEKITLINDEFIVWIIPDKSGVSDITHALIALNKGGEEPQLEAAFIASGVYNNSRLILLLLDKFLNEIHETEAALSKFKNSA